MLAWLVAAFAAAFVFLVALCIQVAIIVALQGPLRIDAENGVPLFIFMWLYLSVAGAIFGAIPGAVALGMVRDSNLRRPMADIFAALLVVHSFVLLGALARTSVFTDFAIPATIGGVVGGLAYWEVAGRPRPPYAQR